MNMRWILAGVAALGLGLAAVPFIPLGTETSASAAAAPAVACEAKAKPANYAFKVKDVDGKVVNQISVDADTAEWARVALQRMLDIT